MSKTFQAPATLTSIGFTADRGLRLTFHTNELSPEEKITASEFHQRFGYVLFRENEFTNDDVPDCDAPDEEKSPSQRLRYALFVLWSQRGEKGDFESFYRKNMDAAIKRVKDLLD